MGSGWKILVIAVSVSAAGMMACLGFIRMGSGKTQKAQPSMGNLFSLEEAFRTKTKPEELTASSPKRPAEKQRPKSMKDSSSDEKTREETKPISEVSAPPAKEAGLWETLDDLKKDPGREILEQRFNAYEVELYFKQASPSGLISFEVINQTLKPIYLPEMKVHKYRAQVLLDRRVIEPEASCAGVIRVEGNLPKRLSVSFGAANLKYAEFQLEVPGW